MRLQQMEVSCETKTKDNVFVLIRVAVQYQVNDDEESIKNAHYRLTNPKQQIESYVFDVVRSSVPKIDLDDVFTTKEEIAQNIKSELTSAMSSFGYTILASPITDIDPDKEVKRAMNDINKAKRLRLAAQDEGEAVKIKAVKEAEAEAAAPGRAGRGRGGQDQGGQGGGGRGGAHGDPGEGGRGGQVPRGAGHRAPAAGHHGGAARVGQRLQERGAGRGREDRHGPHDRHAVLRHDARRRRPQQDQRCLPQPLPGRARGPGPGRAEGLHGRCAQPGQHAPLSAV